MKPQIKEKEKDGSSESRPDPSVSTSVPAVTDLFHAGNDLRSLSLCSTQLVGLLSERKGLKHLPVIDVARAKPPSQNKNMLPAQLAQKN